MTDEPRLDEPRLAGQLAFLLEADRLKQVERRTTIVGGERRENSAEHSWHLALFALVLAEYADEPVDLPRVLTMLLLHDLVEVDAGDTFIYDEAGLASKSEREEAAADAPVRAPAGRAGHRAAGPVGGVRGPRRRPTPGSPAPSTASNPCC